MQYIFKRAGLYGLAALIALTINFFIPRLAPGDPASAALARMGTRVDDSALESLRAAYGLTDQSLLQEFWQYITGIFRGDLGLSFSRFPATVESVIGDTLGWSILLAGTALLISYCLGTLLGIVVAWYRGTLLDRVLPPALLFIGAFPYFFFALLLVYFVGVRWRLLPIGQAYSGTTPGMNLPFIQDLAVHMILPVSTIVIITLGSWVLNMRNAMVTTLGEDYLVLAEAKGLAPRTVMVRHAARNALLPSVTLLGGMIGGVVGGQILTEIVFSYPGVGLTLVQAVSAHDYPLIQGLFLVITLVVLVSNFLVDILYTVLDPRARVQGIQ